MNLFYLCVFPQHLLFRCSRFFLKRSLNVRNHEEAGDSQKRVKTPKGFFGKVRVVCFAFLSPSSFILFPFSSFS